jgi:hypothetical protein
LDTDHPGENFTEKVLLRYLEMATDDDVDQDTLARVFKETFVSAMEATHGDLIARAPQMLAERRAERIGFQARLYARWREAFDLYEVGWEIAHEAGASFVAKHLAEAAQEQDIAFDVLTRLHGRACLIASEVYSLLRAGQATAAMARWRSLHEVTVVSYLIREHGSPLAQRYLDHEVVESLKALNDYESYRERLGAEPIEPELKQEMLNRRTALSRPEMYGPSFTNDYGWASKVAGKANPNIRDLEKLVHLDHLRPYYRLASHGVHLNPKGITFQLEKPFPINKMIIEGSNAGLADPGQSALISLGQCTINFITSKPDIEVVIAAMVLQRIVDEACDAFIKTHVQLEAEEERKRQSATDRDMSSEEDEQNSDSTSSD